MSRIAVDGVGKAYKRYLGKWARLAEWVTGRARRERSATRRRCWSGARVAWGTARLTHRLSVRSNGYLAWFR